MHALQGILWFVALVASLIFVFHFVGMRTMCNFFPEGKRAWHLPVQLLTLVLFALVVLLNPWI